MLPANALSNSSIIDIEEPTLQLRRILRLNPVGVLLFASLGQNGEVQLHANNIHFQFEDPKPHDSEHASFGRLHGLLLPEHYQSGEAKDLFIKTDGVLSYNPNISRDVMVLFDTSVQDFPDTRETTRSKQALTRSVIQAHGPINLRHSTVDLGAPISTSPFTADIGTKTSRDQPYEIVIDILRLALVPNLDKNMEKKKVLKDLDSTWASVRGEFSIFGTLLGMLLGSMIMFKVYQGWTA